jgi:heterodisulfide reductase subunit A2
MRKDMAADPGSPWELSDKKCIGCGECVAACTYEAIQLVSTRLGKKARVEGSLCKGDGLCSAVCPTGAISLRVFGDEEILRQIELQDAAWWAPR